MLFHLISVAVLLTTVWAQQPHHNLHSSPLTKLVRISRKTHDPSETTRSVLLPRKLAIESQSSKLHLDGTSVTSRTRQTATDVIKPTSMTGVNPLKKLPKTLIDDIFQKSRAVDSNSTKTFGSQKLQKKIEGKIASDSNTTPKIPTGSKLPKKIETKAEPEVDISLPKIKLARLWSSISTEPRHTSGEFSSKFKKPSVDTDYNKKSYASNNLAVSPSSRKGTGRVAFPNFKKPSVEGSNSKHRTSGDVSAAASLPRSSASIKLSQDRDIDNSRIRRGPVDITVTASSPRPNNKQLHPKLTNGLSSEAHRVPNDDAGSSL